MKKWSNYKSECSIFCIYSIWLISMVMLEQNTEKRFDKITDLLRETIHDRNLNLSAINSKTPRL